LTQYLFSDECQLLTFGPGDLGFAGTVLDKFGDTSAGGHCVERSFEVGAGFDICEEERRGT